MSRSGARIALRGVRFGKPRFGRFDRVEELVIWLLYELRHELKARRGQSFGKALPSSKASMAPTTRARW